MENKKPLSEKDIEQKVLNDALNRYENKDDKEQKNQAIPDIPTKAPFNPNDFEKNLTKETDEDLIIDFELLDLPSEGKFYENKINQIKVEYMTSIDEDVITTPSLIENGTVLDVLLKRKIKTKSINPEDLISGDRDAIILFLRSSSYGHTYHVNVPDPRTGKSFATEVDLTKLNYKKIEKQPDENGLFLVEIPMRKKIIQFRLLTSKEEKNIFNKAEAIKEAYGHDYSQFNTLKLKAHIVSINNNSDRNYIDKFVDAIPALDSYTIRKEILKVMPGVDLNYEFTAPDGYKFVAPLQMGIDFFFPNN